MEISFEIQQSDCCALRRCFIRACLGIPLEAVSNKWWFLFKRNNSGCIFIRSCFHSTVACRNVRWLQCIFDHVSDEVRPKENDSIESSWRKLKWYQARARGRTGRVRRGRRKRFIVRKFIGIISSSFKLMISTLKRYFVKFKWIIFQNVANSHRLNVHYAKWKLVSAKRLEINFFAAAQPTAAQLWRRHEVRLENGKYPRYRA